MTIYDFMDSSPITTILLALIFLGVVSEVLRYTINRPLRHRNIFKHGWPPEHCDADGDFNEEEK